MMDEKNSFRKMLFKIINPLKPYYDGGFVRFGTTMAWYENIAADMEAFSRPLWGLVPFWAGGGHDEDFEALYKKGLSHAAAWGDCHDKDQRFVEMAAIAYGILFARDKVWDVLSENEQHELETWLLTVNSHEVCDCNWIFFRILVNTALKQVKRAYSEGQIEKDLARIEDFYLGGGWYKDGENGQCDYYIPFAIHFYSLVFSMFDDNKERAEKFRSRAEEFAKDFIYWFDENGDAIPYGRSLTYRFAQAAFWSMCVVAGIRPFSLGVMKGLIYRNLNAWDNIYDESGLLTIGYKYSNINLAEHYNAHGSPYWSLKTFAFLMLDDSHEFWSVPIEEMPSLTKTRQVKEANFLISRRNGHSVLYPAGKNINLWQGQSHNKYLKFAYSAHFGFNVTRGVFSFDEAGVDSMLTFMIDGVVLFRKETKNYEVCEDCVKMTWSPFRGIWVDTIITPTEKGHKRRHIIHSEYDCIAADAGFAVASRDADNMTCSAQGGISSAENKFQKCTVTGDGEAFIINASPNTNILYPKTVIPAVKYEIKKGETVIETEIADYMEEER